ncbi:hypothetical protein [Ekhidna sp.]
MSLNAFVLILSLPFSLFSEQGDKGNDSSEIRIQKGHSLMETVFDRFHINYEMSRIHKVGYYRESMSDSQSLYYLADGIVDIYIPSNLNQIENAYIKPIKTRKKAFKELADEYILLGNASDMARSSIWRPNSFLSDKNREHYTFKYEGDSILNNYDISIISFEPIKTKGEASGKIYVDQHSKAIIKIAYLPDASHSKLWSSVSWSEEFQFRDGAFELSSVRFHGVSSENSYQYDATLVMDQLEVLIRIPENEEYIKENSPLLDEVVIESSSDFWDGYEFLKRNLQSEAEQAILSQLN